MARAEDYEHQPIEEVHLSWTAQPKGSKSFHLLGLDLAIHPNSSKRIIINYPGYHGEREGYMDKHRKLAQYMQGEGLGAVVRGKGPGWPDFDGFTEDVQLRKMIEYALENAQAICDAQRPEVLIIGTSAGGGAAAAIAYEYEAVKRLLLMAPGANMGMGQIERGLSRFPGEVFVIIGENDTNVGPETGKAFYNLATAASLRQLFLIPNCDHNFRGKTNGRIMSQAPFYAFAQNTRPEFPDPTGGIVLY
ncbi:MAG: hypothetical protein HYW45_02805 [Candidatus Daviesbacteria bacterium]|nr:MAG: hypothetical protein HYW45_02805 [Candidatus Daviesbacteria bacterium]